MLPRLSMLQVMVWFWPVFMVVVGLEVGLRECDSAEKRPAGEAFLGIVGDQPRLRVWKRLKVSDSSLVSEEERHLPVGAPVQDRVGVG